MEYHYVRWFPADYLRDTRRLTFQEHGAYLLLLNEYYLSGEPIPDNDEWIAQHVLSIMLSEWLALRPAVIKHFQVGDGVLRHSRCDEEIQFATSTRAARVAGAEAMHAKRRAEHSAEHSAEHVLSIMQPEPELYLESESKPLKSRSKTLPETVSKKPENGALAAPTVGRLVWDSYCKAMKERYDADPPLSRTSASLCKKFAEKMPAEDAPKVAEFYVHWNQKLYVESGHCLELLCRDAQKIHMGWQNGRVITSKQARDTDRLQGQGQAYVEVIMELREKGLLEGEPGNNQIARGDG